MINILSTPMQECFGYPARPVLDDSPDDRLAKPDVQVSADTQGSADPDTTGAENSISAPHSAAAGDKSDVEVPPASNTSEGAPPANSNKTGGDGVSA